MSQGIENPDPATHGQQVLVLQGGGALGAYQVGVYQALDQFGIDLDWVVGTSIGAINAAIIAGSPRAERMHRMRTDSSAGRSAPAKQQDCCVEHPACR